MDAWRILLQWGPMKVAILDDYFDTLRTLHCFAKVASFDVTVFNDHTDDEEVLAERLKDAEVLVLIRELPLAARRLRLRMHRHARRRGG